MKINIFGQYLFNLNTEKKIQEYMFTTHWLRSDLEWLSHEDLKKKERENRRDRKGLLCLKKADTWNIRPTFFHWDISCKDILSISSAQDYTKTVERETGKNIFCLLLLLSVQLNNSSIQTLTYFWNQKCTFLMYSVHIYFGISILK